ncbi:MAG: hypothetical protein PHG66_05260 [Candidatus Colwellbacteria bacterium]|nr:hypothetical protein [Candidatus Colwellbacteria bacterium]
MDSSIFQNLINSLQTAGQALIPAVKAILNVMVLALEALANLIKQGLGSF